MTFTFALACLVCFIFFGLLATLSVVHANTNAILTRAEREGWRALGVLAGFISAGFFIAWLFVWAGESA